MTKRFNITGSCNPGRHWMADVSRKIDVIMKMATAGDYFIINRPRQYGKTTTLSLLEKKLAGTGKFLPIRISFESVDAQTFKDYKQFIETFLGKIGKELKRHNRQDLHSVIQNTPGSIRNFFHLEELLEQLNSIEKHIILMIDEVDQASNNQLFLDFLALLRSKYLERNEGKGFAFHSVILAGVHDVKTLKSKIRSDEEQKFNSPWNIAAPFDIDMGFDIDEISSLLAAYSRDKNVEIDIPEIAEKIYYYTSGYPFLVSYTCKILDEKILEGKNKWHTDDIEIAVNQLLKETNTNFDSLIKNLENDPELYAFIKTIAIEGELISYHVTDNLVSLAKTYGMLREEKGNCVVHNRVYEQLIYDHMTLKLIREKKTGKLAHYTISSHFTGSDGSLDFEKVLLKFQEFMKDQYSSKDRDFLERNGRLVFQAFLRPIINGSGFDFKEAQISEEKRLDIAVTWGNVKYIVELKIWRGPKAHEDGIRQLAEYLDRTNSRKGYLVIFDSRKNAKNQLAHKTEYVDEKEIFVVRV